MEDLEKTHCLGGAVYVSKGACIPVPSEMESRRSAPSCIALLQRGEMYKQWQYPGSGFFALVTRSQERKSRYLLGFIIIIVRFSFNDWKTKEEPVQKQSTTELQWDYFSTTP